MIVKPDTVVDWHRRGFRWYWTWKVRHGKAGETLSHCQWTVASWVDLPVVRLWSQLSAIFDGIEIAARRIWDMSLLALSPWLLRSYSEKFNSPVRNEKLL